MSALGDAAVCRCRHAYSWHWNMRSDSDQCDFGDCDCAAFVADATQDLSRPDDKTCQNCGNPLGDAWDSRDHSCPDEVIMVGGQIFAPDGSGELAAASDRGARELADLLAAHRWERGTSYWGCPCGVRCPDPLKGSAYRARWMREHQAAVLIAEGWEKR